MKLNPKIFIIFSALLLFCFGGLYYLVFIYQLGSYSKAEWWIRDIYQYKDFQAKKKPSPRILIVGGSSSLFGINSEILQNVTGYNVINIAGHAGLTLDFHYQQIKKYMKEGDIIVMPLEYQYYARRGVTDWFTNNMLAWGHEAYLSKISFIERIKFIFSVPKTRIYEGVLNKNKSKPLPNKDQIISYAAQSDKNEWSGYDFRSMNKYGEINVNSKPLECIIDQKKSGLNYISGSTVSDHFLHNYYKIEKLTKDNNGILILTWPPSIKNKAFDLSTSVHKKLVHDLSVNLQHESIQIECDPQETNLDIRYFFNTKYHLNSEGANLRSEQLADCLTKIIPAHDSLTSSP